MLLAAVLLPATLSQASVTLKYMPPIGKTLRYRMVMDMKQGAGAMGSINMTTSTDISIKAVSRTGDVTTVETKTANGHVTLPPGSPMAGMKDAMEKNMSGKSITSKMNSHYGVVGSENGLMASMSAGSGAMSGLSFPTHPVKVGDTWSASIDFSKISKGAMGGMSMNGNVPIKMKLTSISGGNATIAISMLGTLKIPMGAGASAQTISTKMDGKGSFVCSLSDGTLVSSSMVTDTTTLMGATTMKQHMVQTMKRL